MAQKSNSLSPARKAALYLLLGVLQKQQSLAELSVNKSSPMGTNTPADRARALRLARAVLRNLAAIDAILCDYITLERTPNRIKCILRLCAVELWVFDETAYGVVDSAVKLTSLDHTNRFKGLVNAVARKLATHPKPDLSQTPQPIPKGMAGQLKALFDPQRIQNIAAAHQGDPPIDITLKNPSGLERWAKALEAQILPQGSLRLAHRVQVSTLPGFSDGEWWVQDAGAALPAKLIKGQNVLDLCAAPGGKTLQLAASGAQVTAVDISQERLALLAQNLQRTDLSATVICSDACAYHPSAPFDAILLDAPCSASGTIRRHPDLPFIKGNADLAKLLELQRRLLQKATTLLRPQGQLIYATCSLFAAEGEAQAQWANTHLPLTLQRIKAAKLGLPSHFVNDLGQIRLAPDLWPHWGGIDGFFVAEFKKNG